jgi:hypothetical protein
VNPKAPWPPFFATTDLCPFPGLVGARPRGGFGCRVGTHSTSINPRDQQMTMNNRENWLPTMLAAISPHWAVAYMQRQRSRQRARARLERLRAAPDTSIAEPEPRKPVRVGDVWLRANPRAASQSWRQYQPELSWHRHADQLRAERRGTSAADNLVRRYR